MPVLDRIRRIAQANIAQWLNQAEAPESEVEAKIQELEAGAVDGKNALANFAVTYKRLEKNIQDLRGLVADNQLRAEQELAGGDEAAARRALSDKLKASARIEELTPVLESRRATYNELKESLVELHDQLSQARARLLDLRARKRAADAEQMLGHSLDEAREPRGESFARLEDAVLESESRADVEKEIRGELSSASVDVPLRERKVEDELAALKAKISNPDSDT